MRCNFLPSFDNFFSWINKINQLLCAGGNHLGSVVCISEGLGVAFNGRMCSSPVSSSQCKAGYFTWKVSSLPFFLLSTEFVLIVCTRQASSHFFAHEKKMDFLHSSVLPFLIYCGLFIQPWWQQWPYCTSRTLHWFGKDVTNTWICCSSWTHINTAASLISCQFSFDNNSSARCSSPQKATCSLRQQAWWIGATSRAMASE